MKLRLKQMIAATALAWLALAPPGFAAFQIIGDDICVVASEYKKFEAEIERARKGDLSRSNSTLVNPRKNRPPIKEKYSTQVSLTKDSGGNAHVAAVALVSDDGCDVRVNGEQWLKESGKGHDISRGLRRYGKLLLPGDENRFDIEYSQTFYDPAVLENDLDGLTMVVLPIEIDISVKDSRGNVNDRILVKKGETIDVAINPAFWEHDLPGNNNIEWEIGRANDFLGTIKWIPLEETGAKVSLRMRESGIFRIRASIRGKYYYYRRHSDIPNHKGKERLSKGDFDYVGVYTHRTQKRMVETAYRYCMINSKEFLKSTKFDVELYGGRNRNDEFVGADKCNIFVFVVADECGVEIGLRVRGYDEFPYLYHSPPTVSEWGNQDEKIASTPPPFWIYYHIDKWRRPEPGFVVMSPIHMGIVDYDGSWISAGRNGVNKLACIGSDGIGSLGYMYNKTTAVRNRESD